MAEPVGSIRDPFGARTAPRRPTQEGETRDGGRLTYKNGKWVETFNIREGQQSTLGGKPVTADGKGNWERIKYNSDGSFTRTKVGTYKPGIRYGGEKTIAPVNAPSVLNLNTPKSKDKKPPAPAKPEVKPSASLSIPPSAAQPGTGPKGNEVGSDSDPGEPGLQGPGDPKGPPGARVNANGLVSYGKDLSSLNAFTKAFAGVEIADIKTSYKSEDLPSAYQTGSNSIQDTTYELPEGSAPTTLNNNYKGANGEIPTNSGYEIPEASVPGTLGRSGDAQEGSSDKPDIADEVRAIRMNRNSGRGSRRDPRNRGEDPDMFGGPEPSDASLVSPMYANAKRNKIRSTFLDHEGSSVQAIAAANAVAGYGKDSNADARFNVGGELVYAKEGMQQKAKNAAMMGKDPREFLAIGADTPTETQLQSGLTPGSVTAPENIGGSLETPAPITKASPEKFKQTQDFLSGKMDMLTMKTK